MAELILSPIADKIIWGLESTAVKEIALLWRVEKELDQLEETILTIKAVLLDAEEKQVHNHQVKNWLERLGRVVHDADDLMDVFNTEALRRQVMPGSEMAKQVCTFFSASNQLAFRHKMSLRIREIRKKLVAISNDKNFLLEVRHDQDTQVMPMMRRRETHSFVRQEEVIGRDEDRRKIVKLLLDQGELGENVSVIPIVGIGGLGKTTLAQSVFNEKMVQQHFELKIWVCVYDDFDLKLIVQQIVKSATNNNNLGAIPIDSMDLLQKEFQKVISGKVCLFVLDDVWEENREEWLKLKELLLCASTGSRVIVTTRSKMVAKITGTVQSYQLGALDEEKSWSLFEKMAFTHEEERRNSKVANIGRQIVQRCGGVPLVIRAIGSMLYFKSSESEWLSFHKRFLETTQPKEDDILPTLKLSYDHLNSHLKCCFAYSRLFPKDHKIEVQTLVKLWMAQGLVKLQDPSDDQCLEDVGYGYFVDLFERSFFQEVEVDEWGVVRRCKMHDLMHDLATKVAGKECAIVSLNSEGNISRKVDACHVSFDFNISSPRKIPSSLVKARKIRTFLLLAQYSWENKWTESTCYAMISNFKLICTLDLNGSGITVLPKSIGTCQHLRYLDLSKNWKLQMLPDSITNLLNLQTLRLNGCSRLQELPGDLKKLVNLRHLEIDGCYDLTHMPSGFSHLTNLQTLSKYVLTKSNGLVAKHGGKLKELMRLNYLRGKLEIPNWHVGKLTELNRLNKLRGKLEILNLRHGKDATIEYEFANLKEKQYLRSLELKWNSNVDVDETEGPVGYEMSLEVLQPHPNLQELALANYGGVKISSWLSSLTNLVNLSLRWCTKCRHLVPLNQFHLLKKLELEDLPCLEYIDSEEDLTLDTKIVLPSLRELRLKNLPNLKGWWRDVVSEEVETVLASKATSTLSFEANHPRLWRSFPCLLILEIKNCPQLTRMPLYPHLEESLWLENTRLKPFQETIESNMHRPLPIPTISSLSPLSKLTYLDIRIIEDLQCLPDWFKGLTSLKRLKIWRCTNLKDLSPGIQHLTSLGELRIGYCKELEEMMVNGDVMVWKSPNIRRLQSLALQGFHKFVALPKGIQHLTSLQELRFWFCDSLTTIPEWIGNLNSLKLLQFRHCPKLTSLPEGLRSLTSLKLLSIAHCPILLKRCQRTIGEDWPKIAHIEDLDFEPDPNEDNQNL